jgi:hypothetical protein
MHIEHYYQLALQIQGRSAPGEASTLLARATDLEREILAQYGLPPSRRFVRILQGMHRYKKLNQQVLEKIVQRLETAAAEYLLSTPLPDEQILSRARAKHMGALDVLPEMGIPTHDYMVFVYDHFCNHRRVTAAQVIKEYRLVKEHHCLHDIFLLMEAIPVPNDPAYIQLKSYGLQFLDAYLKFQRENEQDHLTQKEMKRELRQLMDKAAASYLEYLQLRSHGMKDTQARQHVGLEDDVFYRIALFTFMLQKDE